MTFNLLSRRQVLAGISAMSASLPLANVRVSAAALARAPVKPFTELFGPPTRGRIQLDRNDYDIGYQTLSWSLSNVWVKGLPGGSRIHGTARTLLSLQSSRDCVFENITFEVTANIATSSSYEAVVRAAQVLLRNHRFIRCRFIVRRANQNAVKLIAEKGDSRIDSLHFEDCSIDGAGRMGIELQNHAADTVQRLTDFRWQGGAVRDTGLLSSMGMGISLSGLGTDHLIDTLFENNRFAALENIGCSNSRFSGRSRLQSRGKTAPVSFTNKRTMRNNVITDFVCLDRASGGCRIWNQLDLTMRDNRFIASGPVDFRGVARLRSSGDRYDSSGPLVLAVDHYPASGIATENNLWDVLTLNVGQASAASDISPVRFTGADTHNNVLRNVSIWTARDTTPEAIANALSKAAGERGNGTGGSTTINGKRLRAASLKTTRKRKAPTKLGRAS